MLFLFHNLRIRIWVEEIVEFTQVCHRVSHLGIATLNWLFVYSSCIFPDFKEEDLGLVDRNVDM